MSYQDDFTNGLDRMHSIAYTLVNGNRSCLGSKSREKRHNYYFLKIRNK